MKESVQEIGSALPPDLDALPRLGGFRLRGIAMTRLETFIDAAFAFAITMLVIATQQIPDDIETLLAAFKNVPAFVASIIVLGIFWRGHGLWSRRYGLEHGVSIFISWAMIVTMLIYIYPLKAAFQFHVVFGQRRPGWSRARRAIRMASPRSLRGFCLGIHRDRCGDGPSEFTCVAIAGTVAVGSTITSNDVSRGNRMEYSSGSRNCFAGAGVMPAEDASRVERLDLFLHGHSRATAQSLL
jgi:hypothetical protein